MTNPPKAKGTGGERQVLREFQAAGFHATRTPAGWPFDIEVSSKPDMAGRVVDTLVTRPDRGRWLVTITLPDFLDLLGYRGYGAHVEVKRRKTMAHHTLWESELG